MGCGDSGHVTRRAQHQPWVLGGFGNGGSGPSSPVGLASTVGPPLSQVPEARRGAAAGARVCAGLFSPRAAAHQQAGPTLAAGCLRGAGPPVSAGSRTVLSGWGLALPGWVLNPQHTSSLVWATAFDLSLGTLGANMPQLSICPVPHLTCIPLPLQAPEKPEEALYCAPQQLPLRPVGCLPAPCQVWETQTPPSCPLGVQSMLGASVHRL